jgi:4-hydroxy-tetrahydrodipicolinate reductase
MTDMKIGIIGAGGRMGQACIRQVTETSGCSVVAASDIAGSPAIGNDAGEAAGAGTLGIDVSDDAAAVIVASDAVIEFTLPEPTVDHVALTADAGVAHIIGTTGMTADQEAALKAAGEKTVVMHAPNMSLAVNLLFALTKQVAAALNDDFDIEVFEMHHKHKVDAPSGTAVGMGRAAAEGRGVNIDDVARWAQHGITGERKRGDIGFASLRGGNVVGDHTVTFAVEDERLEISHKAQSRQIFARGAVHAALWSAGQKPGFYKMFDVLGIDY